MAKKKTAKNSDAQINKMVAALKALGVYDDIIKDAFARSVAVHDSKPKVRRPKNVRKKSTKRKSMSRPRRAERE